MQEPHVHVYTMITNIHVPVDSRQEHSLLSII